MTPEEVQKIFSECNRFFALHYPVKMKDQLTRLAESTASDERTDFYGIGKLIEDFESEVAGILGKTKAVFMPSGTMAQNIAMRIYCDQKQNPHFGIHPFSHLEIHEQKAYSHLHQLKAILLGDKDKILTLKDIQAASTKLSAVIVELPQRENGGILPEWSELQAMSEFCRKEGIHFHLDGARLWEAGPYYKKSYADICALFDSVYVSFYKGLGGMTGAILAGPEDFIKEAKIWQRRQGGNLFTLFPYVLSSRIALKLRLNKMASYHEKAKEVASILNNLGFTVTPTIPQANMMHIFFEGDQNALEEKSLQIAKDEKVMLFRALQPTATPNKYKWELSVGDALLDISKSEIEAILTKLKS